MRQIITLLTDKQYQALESKRKETELKKAIDLFLKKMKQEKFDKEIEKEKARLAGEYEVKLNKAITRLNADAKVSGSEKSVSVTAPDDQHDENLRMIAHEFIEYCNTYLSSDISDFGSAIFFKSIQTIQNVEIFAQKYVKKMTASKYPLKSLEEACGNKRVKHDPAGLTVINLDNSL